MTHYISVGLGTFLFQYFMLSAVDPAERPGAGTIVINFILSLFLWPVVLGLMLITGNLQRQEEAKIKAMIEEAYRQVGADIPEDGSEGDATILAFAPKSTKEESLVPTPQDPSDNQS
jgi:hypothetical protein